MTVRFREFEWQVDIRGNEWTYVDRPYEERSAANEGSLTEELYLREPPKSLFLGLLDGKFDRRYSLEKFSGLFRLFARTELDKTGIKSFADRFGLLGLEYETGIAGSTEMGNFVPGEPLEIWKREIILLREAIAIWKLIQARDADSLINFCSRDEATGEFGPFDGKPYWRVSLRAQEDTRERILNGAKKRGAIFWEAKRELSRLINGQLRGRCAPQLGFVGADLFDPKSAPTAIANFEVIRRAIKRGERPPVPKPQSPYEAPIDWSPLGIQIEARNLVGALWLQLALAIDGNKKYRECEQCHIPFEIKPKGQHQRYCSAACKQAAFRDRKERQSSGEKS